MTKLLPLSPAFHTAPMVISVASMLRASKIRLSLSSQLVRIAFILMILAQQNAIQLGLPSMILLVVVSRINSLSIIPR